VSEGGWASADGPGRYRRRISLDMIREHLDMYLMCLLTRHGGKESEGRVVASVAVVKSLGRGERPDSGCSWVV
jgi:hypothetical protein